jgi:hypothetical protein
MTAYTKIGISLIMSILLPYFVWASDKNSTPFSELDQVLQYRISAEMGRDNPEYHFEKDGDVFFARNSAIGIKATVSQSGVNFKAGNYYWGLKLKEEMPAEMVSANHGIVESVVPEKNKIEFSNPGNTMSWYVNGPMGFQQGWTVSKPTPGQDGYLSLSFTLTGNLNHLVNEDSRGITLVDNNNTSILSYHGLLAFDAENNPLPVRFIKMDETLKIIVDDRGASYPIVIDPWLQSVKLYASDMWSNDYNGSGVTVSADGKTVVTGAYGADFNGDPPFSNAGAAYIFEKPTEGWLYAGQTAKISASDKASSDFMGTRIAINADGSTIVVSSYGSDPDGISDAGALYVFERPEGGWENATETAKLIASDKAFSDALGWGLSISKDGSVIAGGAINADHRDGTSTAGAVYVFKRSEGGWTNSTESAKLIAEVNDPGDKLGRSVKMSSDAQTIVAGAPKAHTFNSGSAGAAYVFEMPLEGWTGSAATPIYQTAKLIGSDRVALDEFGTSVDISYDGKYIAIGNHRADFPVAADAGAAYVFSKPENGWTDATETAKLSASDMITGDWFGYSVSIDSSGSTLAVGAYRMNSGSAYIYKKPTDGWITATENNKILASDGVKSDFFGQSVCLNSKGDELVVGAWGVDFGTNSNAGAVYVFNLSNNPTSLNNSKSEKYSLYPNPVSDFVFINGLKVAETNVKIYNLLGIKVCDKEIHEGGINLGNLKPGIYYLRVAGKTLKMIKK